MYILHNSQRKVTCHIVNIIFVRVYDVLAFNVYLNHYFIYIFGYFQFYFIMFFGMNIISDENFLYYKVQFFLWIRQIWIIIWIKYMGSAMNKLYYNNGSFYKIEHFKICSYYFKNILYYYSVSLYRIKIEI